MLMRPEILEKSLVFIGTLSSINDYWIADALMNYKQHNMLATGPKGVQGSVQGGVRLSVTRGAQQWVSLWMQMILSWIGSEIPFLNWLKYFRGQTCSNT